MTDKETRVTSSTGGQKGDKRAKFSDIPVAFLWALADHYRKGNSKYADADRGVPNWSRGYPYSLTYNAASRHLTAWWNGETYDQETGTHHLIAVAWHAATGFMFDLLAANERLPEEFDDRPQYLPGAPEIHDQPPTSEPQQPPTLIELQRRLNERFANELQEMRQGWERVPGELVEGDNVRVALQGSAYHTAVGTVTDVNLPDDDDPYRYRVVFEGQQCPPLGWFTREELVSDHEDAEDLADVLRAEADQRVAVRDDNGRITFRRIADKLRGPAR